MSAEDAQRNIEPEGEVIERPGKVRLRPSAASPGRGSTAPSSIARKRVRAKTQRWLNLQCEMIQDVSCGLIFRISNDLESTGIIASWPEKTTTRKELLRKVLITARKNKAHLEQTDSPGSIRIYHPLPLKAASAERIVLVLELQDRDAIERATVANLVHWNCEWLNYALSANEGPGESELSDMFSMGLACLDKDTFRSTAMSLVMELASRFSCQRVSFGLRKRNRTDVQVLSHSARVKHETNLVQAIADAMDEAVDQDSVIVYPLTDRNSNSITLAHAVLAEHTPNATLCSVPLSVRGEIVGALTLERNAGNGFVPSEILQIEQLLAFVAPVLSLKHRDEQSLAVKVGCSIKRTALRLFGPDQIKLKLWTLAGTAMLVFFSVAQGSWKIAADAVVEGSVQRTVAAPIDGYISSAGFRAGDRVTAGQELGALDDSDLQLERLKWSTLRQQMVSESREAMAKHKRANVAIINTKIEQVNAELKLIDEQLARIKLLAPIGGIVIEGDLSQLLGTPVSRGDALFKVAPLDDYRIVLRVDEQDIAPVKPGQFGKLVLASMPGRKLDLRVEKMTPVSTARGGRNFFRVEASLLDTSLSLQPGMEGVGKIEIGEARLIWIWTHDLVSWLRLQTWTWWR